MASPELQRQPNPEENGNIRIVNPADLMRDNPAALIYNKETYNRMSANFFPSMCQPVHTVKVFTYSAVHGEQVREFVVDGMTRTKYVYDNQEKITKKYPGFGLRVQDTTAEYLENSLIVIPEERIEGQRALTMLQYLRAVVPPTIEHSQIASDRIAAHLINGWDNMVGPELAIKYSALAALSLLGNQALNIATDEGLRRDLARQERLTTQETIEERVRLQEKLVEMGAVIRQTRLNRQELAQSAFMLVVTESPVIGGEREARKQIFGLLHTPELERKLDSAFPHIGEREQMRYQIGKVIFQALKTIGQTPNRQEAINVLGETLRNPLFNLNNALDVLTAPNPVERYPQVQREVNKGRLERVHMSSYKLQNLTEVESQLIDRLGSVANLSDAEIEGLTSEIRSSNTVLQRAERFITQITEQKDSYLEQGVNEQLLNQAISQTQAGQEAVNNAESLRALRANNRTLISAIDEATRRINNQITVRRIGNIVDEVTGDKLKEGYGPSVRRDILQIVFGEFKEVTQRNQEQIKERIRQLSSLDHDLFVRVRDNDMRLLTALQRQQERNRPQPPDVPPTTPPVEAKPAQPVGPPAPPPVEDARPPLSPVDTAPVTPVEEPTIRPSDVETEVVIPSTPTAAEPTVTPVQSVEPEDIVDIQQREEERKQINRERYYRALSDFYRLLNEVDLTPQDITATEREATNAVVRHLGRLVYGHPDAARILRGDYNRLLQENIRLQEQLLGRDTRYRKR